MAALNNIMPQRYPYPPHKLSLGGINGDLREAKTLLWVPISFLQIGITPSP